MNGDPTSRDLFVLVRVTYSKPVTEQLGRKALANMLDAMDLDARPALESHDMSDSVYIDLIEVVPT
jgi:hypothetical protein